MSTILVTKVFNCLSGNSGLTEEFIYTKITEIETLYKVLSSSTLDTTKLGFIPKCTLDNNKELKVFEQKQGILIARNGKAGQMTYLRPWNYTINDHAYILSLRDDFKTKNNITTFNDEKGFLLWFICSYQFKMYEFASKTDNATWNKGDFLTMTIDIPSTKDEIVRVAALFEDCLQPMKQVQQVLEAITNLKSKGINTDSIASIGEVPIKKLLGYVSRNDSLSEEGIYHHLPEQDDKEPINVLSGSTENLYYGKVSSNTANIHILDKIQGLHVVSRGHAGKITYIPTGKYATNTNAFLFYLRPEMREKIGITNDEQEKVYLKFLRIYLQPIFYDASSESDLSVFPLTELMKKLSMPLFVYTEQMKRIVEDYDIVDKYEKQLEIILYRLDSLLFRPIISPLVVN